MTRNPALLTLENIDMCFGGLQALKQVDLTVHEGSITALIGPNGAGKTTLFNCITGFYRATRGNMVLHNAQQDICLRTLLGEPFTPHDLLKPNILVRKLGNNLWGGSHRVSRAGIARTFQNIRLFKEMTVIENLMVAQHRSVNRNILAGLLQTPKFKRAEQNAIEHAYENLALFNLLPDANRLAGELPYGKQRRLEIARALVTRPRLLCLDEPAAGLNPSETAELTSIIRRIRDNLNVTIFLIEHDIRLVMSLSETIYVLDHGEIIAHGSPQEIRKNPHVIAAYLGMPEDHEH